jgi:hypothetical protein
MLPAQKKAYIEAETQMWLAILKDIQAGDKNVAAWAQDALKAEDVSLTMIPNAGARTTRLRQIMENLALLGGPDVSATFDEFEERYDGSRPEPWVAFTEFRDSAYILAERLTKRHKARVGIYTGDQSSMERTWMEDQFQAGDLDLIVGTIGAMKEGITLTKAKFGYMFSESWVPAINGQCQARYADRTGQHRKATTFIPQVIGTVGTSKVRPTNELRDKIVRAVYPVDKIEEVYES